MEKERKTVHKHLLLVPSLAKLIEKDAEEWGAGNCTYVITKILKKYYKLPDK